MAKLNQALFSSDKQTWKTPAVILMDVRCINRGIALDPATSTDNPTEARKFFTPQMDGLSRSWKCDGLVYVNPPYGKGIIDPWCNKVIAEAIAGTEIAVLVPSRTDRPWYQNLYEACDSVCWYRKRIRFVGAQSGAPFPSAMFYFGPHKKRFRELFSKSGLVLDVCR